MFNLVPSRFAEPKWQAYITPEAKCFEFSSGRKIKSLYDLKVALTEESEDVIVEHLKEGKNDIADWVGNVLGDNELADDLRHYDHRWGLIVSLERHMMRSLSLPSYVAKRWLKPAEISFTFVSGQLFKSLEELLSMLKEVSDDTIAFHRERVPNDISKWMMDIIGDYQLAELIEESSNRIQMIHFVEDHIEMLKEAAQNE
jgi:hypothetical protein